MHCAEISVTTNMVFVVFVVFTLRLDVPYAIATTWYWENIFLFSIRFAREKIAGRFLALEVVNVLSSATPSVFRWAPRE